MVESNSRKIFEGDCEIVRVGATACANVYSATLGVVRQGYRSGCSRIIESGAVPRINAGRNVSLRSEILEAMEEVLVEQEGTIVGGVSAIPFQRKIREGLEQGCWTIAPVFEVDRQHGKSRVIEAVASLAYASNGTV